MAGMTRKYRTGSLYQRSSDGRWIGAVPDGHGGVLRYVTGTSRDSVERRLNEARRNTTSRRPRAAAETVAAYILRWLDTREGRLAPRTVASYRSVAEHHLRRGKWAIKDIADALGTSRGRVTTVLKMHHLAGAGWRHRRPML